MWLGAEIESERKPLRKNNNIKWKMIKNYVLNEWCEECEVSSITASMNEWMGYGSVCVRGVCEPKHKLLTNN